MGNACQDCFQMFQTPKKQRHKGTGDQPPVSSERRMTRKTQVEFYNNDQQTATDQKKNGGCDSSLNSSCQDAKAFSRRESVALGSNFGQRKSCLSNLSTIAFDQGSVVIMGPGSKLNKSNYRKQEYYSVIQNVYMIRKTADSLKVTSPSGLTSELNCPPQYLASTLFAAQGIPLESILQIGNQKSIIQNSNSPIKLTIRLCCLGCKKKVKLTFCKSYVNIQELKCKNQKCQKKAGWSLLDIDANAAIWADGRKMDNHQQLQEAPSEIRILGCIICMRYSNLTKQLKCGCMICKNCLTVNEIQQIQCPICEADVFLQ